MSISDKQLEANRRNAERSTGPRTVEGKRRSSLNAFRHGLTGQISILTDAERGAHDKFFTAYVADLKPEGAVETDLAHSAAEDGWRLKRIRAVEDNIFALGHPDLYADPEDEPHSELETAIANARTFVADPKKFQLLTLYEQRLHRSQQKSLALLKQLQAERKSAQAAALEHAKILALTSYMKGKPYDPAKDFPPENGFLFSTAEINLAIHRDRRLEEASYHRNRDWNAVDPWETPTVKIIEVLKAA